MSYLAVKSEEFGVEKQRAEYLIGSLPQIREEKLVLEKQYNEIIRLDITDPKTAVRAREVRLLIRDNRTKGIMPWHKTTKEVPLREGQLIDALKNKEVAENERMESALEEIEKYAQIQEENRQKELSSKRLLELSEYMEFVPSGLNFGTMEENAFAKVLNGAKLQLDEKIRIEKELEAARIIKEEEEKRLREEQRLENERLKAEAEKREKEIEAERKVIEQKIAKERAKAKAEADRIEAENKKKLKAEQEARAKLEAELQAKKDAEIKTENERKQAELKAKAEAEKLAKAPIKDKLNVWVDGFKIDLPDSELLNNDITLNIKIKFEAFKSWAKSQIEKI